MSSARAAALWLLLALLGVPSGGNAEPPIPAAETIIHEETSLYFNIVVFEKMGVLRCLRFGPLGGPQSCIIPQVPDRLASPYARMMLTALYVQPNPRTILLIGLGGGTLQSALAKLYPDAIIDTAEIDSAILKVAETYFNFKTGPKQRVAIEDGRVFVKHALKQGKHYDIIMLDAFRGEIIPEHMLTQEFMKETKNLLAPGGAFVANAFAKRGLYERQSATYDSVYGGFAHILSGGNRIVLAQKDGAPTLAAMEKNAAQIDQKLASQSVSLAWARFMFSRERDWDPKTPILTDQYAPVNVLNAKP